MLRFTAKYRDHLSCYHYIAFHLTSSSNRSRRRRRHHRHHNKHLVRHQCNIPHGCMMQKLQYPTSWHRFMIDDELFNTLFRVFQKNFSFKAIFVFALYFIYVESTL